MWSWAKVGDDNDDDDDDEDAFVMANTYLGLTDLEDIVMSILFLRNVRQREVRELVRITRPWTNAEIYNKWIQLQDTCTRAEVLSHRR